MQRAQSLNGNGAAVAGAATTDAAPIIEGFELGPFLTNTYIVHVPGTRTCWVVDPSFGSGPVIKRLAELGLTPQAILLTHAHADHIAGISDVLRAFPKTPIWIHGAESAWLADPLLNLSALAGRPVTTPGPDRELADGDVLTLSGTRWTVLHTPGHSPGGVSFYHEGSGAAIVGDSLMAGSIGRTDFPGGDFGTLSRSIREKLYTLPPTTRVFPGHGPSTTIGEERATNPYVRP